MGSAITRPVDISPEDRSKLTEQLISKCQEVLKQNPNNRCCKFSVQYLGSDHARSLSNADLKRFYSCIKTGIENPDSSLGCYATSPDDYSDFHEFFDAVIRDYHGDVSRKKTHVTDWNTNNDKYDVQALGIDNLSMRVRVGRNLEGFRLPASMTKQMRIDFEKKMVQVFEKLGGGTYHSLSPDLGDNEPNPNLISDDAYKSLVEDHVMFKDMSADPYLNSAGISSDWPYGRGCWVSEDKMRVIWVGEEDQLRIMSMKQGTNLLEVFTDLKDMLDTIESTDGVKFASHQAYGYLTSCPSNLGTGMRASVHLKVPALTSDGTDTMLKHLCKPLGFSVRGTGGEHTPIVDGMVDISPSSRLFISEGNIISALYSGIKDIALIENKVLSNIESLNTIKGKLPEGCDAAKQKEMQPVPAEVASIHNEMEPDQQTSVNQSPSKDSEEPIGHIDLADNKDDDEKETCEHSSENPSKTKNSVKDPGEDIKPVENRDDELINYVLIENVDRDQEERERAAESIEHMKDERKFLKVSVSDRIMANQSPRSLQMSPGPKLLIKNE